MKYVSLFLLSIAVALFSTNAVAQQSDLEAQAKELRDIQIAFASHLEPHRALVKQCMEYWEYGVVASSLPKACTDYRADDLEKLARREAACRDYAAAAEMLLNDRVLGGRKHLGALLWQVRDDLEHCRFWAAEYRIQYARK